MDSFWDIHVLNFFVHFQGRDWLAITRICFWGHDDGVDREELMALVDSAFQDGVAYTVKAIGPGRPGDES